jgi:pyrroloquinoline-quinone synthase
MNQKHIYDLDRKKPYTPQEFVELLGKIAEETWAGVHHPLVQKFLKGELTREQMKAWAIQEYWFYKGPSYWSAAEAANAPTLEDQQILMDPLVTEMGTGNKESHVDLYLKYCNALGVTKEEIFSTPLLPATVTAISEFYNICKYLPLPEAISAEKIAGENVNKIRHELYVKAYKKYYSWIPEESLRFHIEHVTEDVGHTQIGEYLVKKYATSKEAQNRMWEAEVRFLSLQWVLYDGIYQAVVNKDNPPMFNVSRFYPLPYYDMNDIPVPEFD